MTKFKITPDNIKFNTKIHTSLSCIYQPALCTAAENGHAALVEILVKAGANVNKVSHVVVRKSY